MTNPTRKFIAHYPKTTVEIRQSISDQLVRAVLTENLDFAIASILVPQPHLLVEPLFKEQIWLFGPRKVRLGRSVSLKFLSDLPLLMARRQNATRDLVERQLTEAGLRLNLVLETDSTSLMEDLIKSGVGYVTAPYFSHKDSLKSGKVSGAPIKGLAISRSLVRRKDRPQTRAMQEFLNLLQPEIHRLQGMAKLV